MLHILDSGWNRNVVSRNLLLGAGCWTAPLGRCSTVQFSVEWWCVCGNWRRFVFVFVFVFDSLDWRCIMVLAFWGSTQLSGLFQTWLPSLPGSCFLLFMYTFKNDSLMFQASDLIHYFACSCYISGAAVWLYGVCSGFATGIYATNLPDACQFIADNAKCNIIVVENDHQLQKILKVWDQLPDLKAVIQFRDSPVKIPNVYSVCNIAVLFTVCCTRTVLVFYFFTFSFVTAVYVIFNEDWYINERVLAGALCTLQINYL